jgi:hypothetical protein
MANTPGLFNGIASSLFGGGQSAADALKANGYTPYQVTQGPNVAGNFAGYQGAQANTSANQPYMQAQSALLGQLGSEAAGTGGPTVADQQLQAGTGQALAAQKAAMAGARGQNAGLAQAQLGTNMANTTAGASGQAAALRANEQQGAQGALGGLTQGAIGQGNQLAEANQASTNQGLAATSQAQQNYGNLQNQDWQYTNNLGANQQAQYNQMIGSMTGAADQSQANVSNQIGGSLINTGIQGASQFFGLQSGAADGMIAMADGGLVGPAAAPHGPTSQFAITGPGGGLSGGTGYDPTARMGGQPMADGGVSIGASAPSMAPFPGINVPTAPAPVLTNYLSSKGGGRSPQQSPTSGGPQADPDTADTAAGKNAGATDIGSINAGMEDMPAADGMVANCYGRVAGMADGAVSAPVAHGPEKAIIGENGPEAVIPIKPNGDVDPARARNPAVKQLLATHPGLRHIQDAGTPQGQPTGTGDHATAAALAMAGAHLSDRVAALEQLLSSQARKSARRAA